MKHTFPSDDIDAIYMGTTIINKLTGETFLRPPYATNKQDWLNVIARLALYYFDLDKIDRELYKEDYIQLINNKLDIQGYLKLRRSTAVKIDNIHDQHVAEAIQEGDELTPDEEYSYKQVMYQFGLCDIENQEACCCDTAPEVPKEEEDWYEKVIRKRKESMSEQQIRDMERQRKADIERRKKLRSWIGEEKRNKQ